MEGRQKTSDMMRFAIATFVILFIWACKDGPQPIKYGVEACYYCKMSIVDNRYAVQIINKKRKVYNFDDIYCCREILSEGGIKTEDIAAMYINDYIRPGVLVHRDSSLYYIVRSFVLLWEEILPHSAAGRPWNNYCRKWKGVKFPGKKHWHHYSNAAHMDIYYPMGMLFCYGRMRCPAG